MWFSPLIQGGAVGQEQPPVPVREPIAQPQRDLPAGVGGDSSIWDFDSAANSVLMDDWFPVQNQVAPSQLRYWNGSQWLTGTLKYWNGSQWLTGTLKYWNGSAWTA